VPGPCIAHKRVRMRANAATSISRALHSTPAPLQTFRPADLHAYMPFGGFGMQTYAFHGLHGSCADLRAEIRPAHFPPSSEGAFLQRLPRSPRVSPRNDPIDHRHETIPIALSGPTGWPADGRLLSCSAYHDSRSKILKIYALAAVGRCREEDAQNLSVDSGQRQPPLSLPHGSHLYSDSGRCVLSTTEAGRPGPDLPSPCARCTSGCFVVSESWLESRDPNASSVTAFAPAGSQKP
jgi:hypothetical protein